MPNPVLQASPEQNRPGLWHFSLPAGCWLSVALWLLVSAAWQWHVHAPGILGDMWDMLAGYQQLGSATPRAILHELLRQFAGVHTLFIPKLFFWLNFGLFAGSGVLLKCLSFMLCGANMLLLCLLVRRDLASVSPVPVFLAAVLVFFNGLQTLVIEWDFLVQHYFAIFFTLLAFSVCDVRGQQLSPRQLLKACCLVLLAVLSCGSGLASLLALGFYLLCRRERFSVLILYVFFSVLLWLLLKPVASDSADAFAVAHHLQPNAFFWSGMDLLFRYLSFPFSAWLDCRWLGVAVTLAALHSAWVCVKHHDASLRDVLLVYFFIIALTVMWGRYRFFTPDTDLSRFYVYLAPLWFLSLLKIADVSVRGFYLAAISLCTALVLAGLFAIAVAADHAGRMQLSAVVARNGNFSHLAGLRLNAMVQGESALQQQHDYLQVNDMDIYSDNDAAILSLPETQPCAATVLRRTAVTKGTYVDYLLRGSDANGSALQDWILVDPAVNQHYAGAVVAERVRMKGWQLRLNEISLQDWLLLLPARFLGVDQTVLYTHLPRTVSLDSLQLWARTAGDQRCRLQLATPVSAVPE
ncbi:MAG TPA: hypothetical protein PLF22_04155 [Pseudomonadales bacterium]|nr:hypothetical protein [Pseudomonadales bacterium]